MTHLEVSRRDFIITTALAGGGMMIGFATPAGARVNEQPWQSPTDKDGVEKYATEVVATDMTMLGSREGMGGGDEGGGGGGGYSRPAARPAASAAAAKPAAKPSTGFDDMDDDIPF